MAPNPKRDKGDDDPDKHTGRAGPGPRGNAGRQPQPRRPLPAGYGKGEPETPGGKRPKQR